MSRKPLNRLQAWRHLVAEPDLTNLRQRCDAVLKAITAHHIPELIAAYRRGDEAVRIRAMVVLTDLARSRDSRLSGNELLEFIDLAEAVASEEHPRSVVGRGSFVYLREAHSERAQAVLLGIDVGTLTDAQRRSVAADLHATSEAAVAQLRRIIELGGEGKKTAEWALESFGIVDMKQIRALAAQWRRKRTKGLLHELYLRYFVHNAGRISIADIIKLMGRPDRRRGHAIWYSPDEWTSVYLEGDARGVLTNMKFTG